VESRHPVDSEELVLSQGKLDEERRSDHAIFVEPQILGFWASLDIDHHGHPCSLGHLEVL